MRFWALSFLPITVFLVGDVAAQQRACRVFFDRAPRFNHIETFSGAIRQFAGGGVRARCIGQNTRMRADSIAYYEDRQRVEFLGSVRFEDSTAVLDADRAFYFLSDERLEAYGNARLENLQNGTVLTGENLTYYRAAERIRDQSILVSSQRPTIHYRTVQTGDEPYVIIGNHVRLEGEQSAWAGGSVTIDRADFHAEGDSTELHLGRGDGVLIGHATVIGGEPSAYVISGREIGFTFAANDLDWVQARGLATARSDEFGLAADTIEFTLEENLVQRGLAWGDSIRPEAVSTVNTITADSLAIDSPGQVLKEIRAFGSARATSVRDSLDAGADWIAGDTVLAQFDEVANARRILVALDGIGNAHAYYRIYHPGQGDKPDINYSRGTKILARFTETGVQRVDVVGLADGVHLEPIRRLEQ